MGTRKIDWDAIPSIENLEVDWAYEPENPLGKREEVRIVQKDLYAFLSVKTLPVKVLSGTVDLTGQLIDISKKGIAAFLEQPLEVAEPVKIGFFLKKEKVVSRALVRNVIKIEHGYRVGIEFVNIDKKALEFIASLVASGAHAVGG